MSQSSPEGIILGKDSKLISMSVKIDKKEIINIKPKKSFIDWLKSLK